VQNREVTLLAAALLLALPTATKLCSNGGNGTSTASIIATAAASGFSAAPTSAPAQRSPVQEQQTSFEVTFDASCR
jgi:hypothetical protein